MTAGANPYYIGESPAQLRVALSEDVPALFAGIGTVGTPLPTNKGGTGVSGPSLGAANGVALADKGTWTPTVQGSTTPGTGTYSLQVGEYTRIGDLVYFWARVHWSATTGTGNFNLAGLPFASRASINTDYPVNVYINGSLSVIQMAIVVAGTAIIEMDKFVVGTPAAQSQALPAAGDLMISGFYPI